MTTDKQPNPWTDDPKDTSRAQNATRKPKIGVFGGKVGAAFRSFWSAMKKVAISITAFCHRVSEDEGSFLNLVWWLVFRPVVLCIEPAVPDFSGRKREDLVLLPKTTSRKKLNILFYLYFGILVMNWIDPPDPFFGRSLFVLNWIDFPESYVAFFPLLIACLPEALFKFVCWRWILTIPYWIWESANEESPDLTELAHYFDDEDEPDVPPAREAKGGGMMDTAMKAGIGYGIAKLTEKKRFACQCRKCSHYEERSVEPRYGSETRCPRCGSRLSVRKV